MKKFISFLFVNIFCCFSCYAESVTENINSSLKTSSYEPNWFSIILSLIFVILLIYITGILYTKLNKFGIKTVKHEFKNADDTKPIIISATPVGHDKTLQVIEIDGERLLIGVAQNSITLIKTLSKKNVQPDYDEKVEEIEVENTIKKEHTVNAEDFGLYKKYLR